MSINGQKLTKASYENPSVVEGYISEHSLQPKIPIQALAEFAHSLPGKNILDLGCGPGHDSYRFAALGYQVTGVDYSSQMIKEARNLKQIVTKPLFIELDIRSLASKFDPDTFDGIWACASLLHIESNDMQSVLSQLYSVLKSEGKAFIGLKGGSGEALVEESKYGPEMVREFTYWQPHEFDKQLIEAGFSIDKFQLESKPNRQNTGNTDWLNYWVSVYK